MLVMRKVLNFTLTCLVVLQTAACTKPALPELEDCPIVFQASCDDNAKAGYEESSVTKLVENGWNCLAVRSAGSATLFSGRMTYGSGVFRPERAVYYPYNESVSFYGVYPNAYTPTAGGGNPYITYSAPSSANVDLIAAKKTGVGRQSSAVTMNFRHILSQLNFVCLSTDGNVNTHIMKITVHAPLSGTYSYSSDSWTSTGSRGNFVCLDKTESSAPLVNGTYDVSSPMTVVPASVGITVKWFTTSKLDGRILGSYEKTITEIMTAVSGESYTVRLSLPNSDSVPIKYTTIIQRWTNTNANISVEPESNSFGDIVLWNGSKTLTVSQRKYIAGKNGTYAGMTPIGVIAWPKGFLPDGKARMVALDETDANGNHVSTVTGIKWGTERARDVSSVIKYRSHYPCIAVRRKLSNGTYIQDELCAEVHLHYNAQYNTSHIPCGRKETLFWKNRYNNAMKTYPFDAAGNVSYYWVRAADQCYLPSPIGSDGRLNPLFISTTYTDESTGEVKALDNIYQDFNGKERTYGLVSLGGRDFPAAYACSRFSTPGMPAGKWYLPTAGEETIMWVKYDAIEAGIVACGGFTYSLSHHWTSSAFYHYNIIRSNYYDLEHQGWFEPTEEFSVRPFAIVE